MSLSLSLCLSVCLTPAHTCATTGYLLDTSKLSADRDRAACQNKSFQISFEKVFMVAKLIWERNIYFLSTLQMEYYNGISQASGTPKIISFRVLFKGLFILKFLGSCWMVLSMFFSTFSNDCRFCNLFHVVINWKYYTKLNWLDCNALLVKLFPLQKKFKFLCVDAKADYTIPLSWFENT
jgi:hypothetical protein